MLVSDCNGPTNEGGEMYLDGDVDEAERDGSEQHNGAPVSAKRYAGVEGVENFSSEAFGLDAGDSQGFFFRRWSAGLYIASAT